MNKEKIDMFCPFCMKKHSVEKICKHETTIFKETNVRYMSNLFYCKETEESWEDEEMLRSNDITMKDAYRSVKGLLTSKEIIELRNQFGVSQIDLCKILGWGEKTIARYESHQVQTRAHDIVLRKIKEDPEWFLGLVKSTKEFLTEKNYRKAMKMGKRMYAKQFSVYEKKFMKCIYYLAGNGEIFHAGNKNITFLDYVKKIRRDILKAYYTRLEKGTYSYIWGAPSNNWKVQHEKELRIAIPMDNEFFDKTAPRW